MADYRRGAHTVFEIHLHLVWTTKYRRQALAGEVATRVRDLIRDICGAHEVTIMKGHVAKDHVHLFVSIPPQVTISRLMQWLKGKPAHLLLAEFPHLKKRSGEATCGREVDLSPKLRQTVKSQNSLNGELTHGIVSTEVHA